jgi:hypothetical protein
VLHNKINNIEYNLLCTYSLVGLIIILATNDFTTIFLALELQSLSFYVLSRFKKDTIFSINNNGFKYFILGSLSSSYFLLGWNLLYDFSDISLLYNLHILFLDVVLFSFLQKENTIFIDNFSLIKNVKLSLKTKTMIEKTNFNAEEIEKAVNGLKQKLLIECRRPDQLRDVYIFNQLGGLVIENMLLWNGISKSKSDSLTFNLIINTPTLKELYDPKREGLSQKTLMINAAIDVYLSWYNQYCDLLFNKHEAYRAEVYRQGIIILLSVLESFTQFENNDQKLKVESLLNIGFVTENNLEYVIKDLAKFVP